jgi:hypothetical protein
MLEYNKQINNDENILWHLIYTVIE